MSSEPVHYLSAVLALTVFAIRATVITMSRKLTAPPVLGICLLASFLHNAAARGLNQAASAPLPDLGPVIEYMWHVTVSSQAPDCFQRNVLLVNGSFQPTLEVVQGSLIKVTPQTILSLTFRALQRCSFNLPTFADLNISA